MNEKPVIKQPLQINDNYTDLAKDYSVKDGVIKFDGLPEPTNKAASGALRLHVTLATGFSPAVCAKRPNSSSSPSNLGRPRSTPTRMVGAAGIRD